MWARYVATAVSDPAKRMSVDYTELVRRTEARREGPRESAEDVVARVAAAGGLEVV